jgi:hypothetical protein
MATMTRLIAVAVLFRLVTGEVRPAVVALTMHTPAGG